MKPRVFNTINVNYQKRLFTKSSSNIPKLKDEIHYYLGLPKKIAAFFPKLIDYHKDFSSYTMEFIPYQNFSELISSHKISVFRGRKVLTQLMIILDNLHRFKPQVMTHCLDVQNFYIEKTIKRIEALSQCRTMSTLVHTPETFINGQRYQSFHTLKNQFIQLIQQYVDQDTQLTIIHGDFCFSNILYNPQNHDIRLIDPRGSFGATGVYGHAYYDYAKILHCLHGRYDCLVGGLYTLTEVSPHNFIFTKPISPLLDKLHQFYKSLLLRQRINIKFLYLIEASLFLSMSVLHYEDEKRQKALYLTGIMILNKFIENAHENMY